MPRKISQPDLFNAVVNAPERRRPSAKDQIASPQGLLTSGGSGAKTGSTRKAKQTGSANGLTVLPVFLSDVEVAKRYGVSRPTIWRWCQTNPGFPAPKQISPGTTRWALSDLQAFDAQLPNKRRRAFTDPCG